MSYPLLVPDGLTETICKSSSMISPSSRSFVCWSRAQRFTNDEVISIGESFRFSLSDDSVDSWRISIGSPSAGFSVLPFELVEGTNSRGSVKSIRCTWTAWGIGIFFESISKAISSARSKGTNSLSLFPTSTTSSWSLVSSIISISSIVSSWDLNRNKYV